MEIMRLRLRPGDRQRQDAGRLDGNRVVLILKDPVDAQEFLAIDHFAELFVEVGIHDHIRNSRFILQTQEHETFRCAGPLPRNHATCNPGVLAVRETSQIAPSRALRSRFIA
jgi:hypothetical protein